VKPFYLSNETVLPFKFNSYRYVEVGAGFIFVQVLAPGQKASGSEYFRVLMGRVACSFARRPLVSPVRVNQ
jgi:hypothetical protein